MRVYFVPKRIYEQLKCGRIRRVRHEEGGGIILAAYINSFKEAFTVLSVSMSEDITVENIFAGMRPAHFSRFIFQNKPQTFVDLYRLAIIHLNLDCADKLLGASALSTPHTVVNHKRVNQPTGGLPVIMYYVLS
jgi:hypothetical protein